MNYYWCFFIILCAGLMNGSFVVPSRYTKGLSSNRIWFYHAIIGMTILPWLIMWIIAPHFFISYEHIALHDYLIIALGGLAFGLGQITFAKSINDIGISLSFPINIGLGLIIGSLYVMISRHVFFSSHSLFVNAAIILILIALLLFYHFRKSDGHNPRHYMLGWLLAGLTGITSGLQNITFILTSSHAQHLNALAKLYWVWPPFLTMAAIVMLIGFFSLSIKEPNNGRAHWKKNTLMITLMGLGFTGSLVLYSLGMEYLIHLEQIIGWPLFMAAIIFTCQLWGWHFDEYASLSKHFRRGHLLGIGLLVIAIILLSV